MITIRVNLQETRSTDSQFENLKIGAAIEAQNLELHTPEQVQQRCAELFQLARGAIQRQLLEPLPSATARTSANGGGKSRGGNGRRRSFGRPQPEPTSKQKQFLRKVARERHLDAETVGQICQRIVGKPVRACNREELSRLIDGLLEEAA